MLPCEWEPRRIVIERGSGPLRRRVAGFACLREARMARILRSLIVREVARRTRRSESSEFSGHVTARACRRGVLPGQREPRFGVIKLRSLPLDGRVAEAAVLREPRGDVIRIRRLLELRQMTSRALRSKACELSADMTTRAGSGRMLARQRELCGGVVIEHCPSPLRRGVTRFTRLRETRRGMIRIRGLLEIRQVAGRTGCAQSRELAASMAARACCRCVFPCERELRRIVIERCSVPLRGRVAGFASGRESCVVWILRSLVVRQVAGGTRGTQSRELASHMASRAGRCRMFPRQWELGRVVIEGRTGPLRGGVTRFARLWKSRRCVVRVASLLEIGQVASGASGADSRKLAADMAARAGGRGMFAGQRELSVRIVIEPGPQPLRRGVAALAGLRKSRRRMIRIRCLLEVR